MSSVFGGGYEELSTLTDTEGQAPDGGRRIAALPGEPHEGVVAIAVLSRIERELRRIRSFTQEYGRQFTKADGALVVAPGVAIITFEGPKSGNDWYVERLTISVSGANAAGGLALYQGSGGGGTPTVPDEGQLLDFLGALSGNNPSRGSLDGRGTPYFLYGGAPVLAVLSGVVVGSSVFARLQGREVLAGMDPALQPQDDF